LAARTISYVILLVKAIPIGLKSDVILAHYHYSNLTGFCAAITSMVSRKPLVIRTDDIVAMPSNPVETFLALVFRFCSLWSFRQAKLVLVSGHEQLEIVQKLYGLKPEEVAISYNGVNTVEFRPENRSDELRRKIGSNHIAVFSGLLSKRGVDVLIRAIALIKPNFPDLRIIVMGDGPDLTRLVDLAASLGVSESIEFMGVVDPRLVPTYVASSDAAIGPLIASRQTHGTTPLKILEYMASGTVVITGKDTVSARLITDGEDGLIFHSGDAEGLARAITRAFSDEQFAEKIRKTARDRVKKNYEWQTVISALEAKLYLVTCRDLADQACVNS
jgi:glycosyltransferase involved in cell wall biosynthesis